MRYKKSQVWTIDFIAGLLIFIVLMLIGVAMIMSLVEPGDTDSLYRDSVHLSGALMTSGNPVTWDVNNSNVIIPGLLIDGSKSRIDANKLTEFDKLDYQRTKTLFHLSSEYIFFFRNSTGIINISKCIRGYALPVNTSCEPDLTSVNYNDLVKIDRIVIYNASIITLTIYSWR